MDIKHTRTKELFGEDFKKLQNFKVLLLGIGGVGGFCLECLYKSGVEDITIVDFDTYDITNQNRQLYSDMHLNEQKVKALKNHYPNIKTLHVKVDKKWVEEFDFSSYDVVLDAIDNREAKIALAFKVHKKLISSFGSAKRIDATKIKVDNIWKTSGDRFGAKTF